MSTASSLRIQIEDLLGDQHSSALSPRAGVKPLRTPCGVAALDELLRGGLPVGVLTELVGTECSGRTSAALAYTAAIAQSGGVCAWIDVADALDPESVAACGVDLERLLWVRCSANGAGNRAAAAVAPQAGQGVLSATFGAASEPRQTGGGSPHPRSEGRDMPQAVSALLASHGGLYDKQVRREKRAIGTPGAPNRPLSGKSEDRVEQVNSDRMPPRRGDNLALMPRCAEPQVGRFARQAVDRSFSAADSSVFKSARAAHSPWTALDQALRATDLLLQGGGFSAIVLDLGSTPPEAAWRIPLATWFRFRASCERTRVSLLLLTQHPCTRSSAELVVHLQRGTMEADHRVMTGIRYRSEVQRSRSAQHAAEIVSIRRPPQSVPRGAWRSEAAWAQVK